MPLSSENEHQGRHGLYLQEECDVCKQEKSCLQIDIRVPDEGIRKEVRHIYKNSLSLIKPVCAACLRDMAASVDEVERRQG